MGEEQPGAVEDVDYAIGEFGADRIDAILDRDGPDTAPDRILEG